MDLAIWVTDSCYVLLLPMAEADPCCSIMDEFFACGNRFGTVITGNYPPKVFSDPSLRIEVIYVCPLLRVA